MNFLKNIINFQTITILLLGVGVSLIMYSTGPKMSFGSNLNKKFLIYKCYDRNGVKKYEGRDTSLVIEYSDITDEVHSCAIYPE